jgi:hypothetical protein
MHTVLFDEKKRSTPYMPPTILLEDTMLLKDEFRQIPSKTLFDTEFEDTPLFEEVKR